MYWWGRRVKGELIRHKISNFHWCIWVAVVSAAAPQSSCEQLSFAFCSIFCICGTVFLLKTESLSYLRQICKYLNFKVSFKKCYAVLMGSDGALKHVSSTTDSFRWELKKNYSRILVPQSVPKSSSRCVNRKRYYVQTNVMILKSVSFSTAK